MTISHTSLQRCALTASPAAQVRSCCACRERRGRGRLAREGFSNKSWSSFGGSRESVFLPLPPSSSQVLVPLGQRRQRMSHSLFTKPDPHPSKRPMKHPRLWCAPGREGSLSPRKDARLGLSSTADLTVYFVTDRGRDREPTLDSRGGPGYADPFPSPPPFLSADLQLSLLPPNLSPHRSSPCERSSTVLRLLPPRTTISPNNILSIAESHT